MTIRLIFCMTLASAILWPLAAATAKPDTDAPAFDCAKARSAAERRICSDAVLRGYDRELAGAWKRARAQSPDRKALEADQQQWLRKRDECGDDLSCLRMTYSRRQVALDHVAGPFRWQGEWTRIAAPGRSASLSITLPQDGPGSLTADAYNGGNSGGFGSTLSRKDANTLVARSDEGCTLTLRRVHVQIEVEQDGSDGECGLGAGVYLDGRYVRGRSDPGPPWDLLSLGVVEQPQRDAEIRRQLGKTRYSDLIHRSNDMYEDDEVPNLLRFGVRGLYPTYMAALYQPPGSNDWWLAIYDDVLLLWSNRADWAKGQAPQLDAWKQERLNHAPVRLMSLPGQPLREPSDTDAR